MAGAFVGCDPLVAVDVRVDRLRLARDLGATHVLRADEEGLPARLINVLPEGGDFCIDATGNPHAFRAAFEVLGTGGTLAMVRRRLGRRRRSASVYSDQAAARYRGERG